MILLQDARWVRIPPLRVTGSAPKPFPPFAGDSTTVEPSVTPNATVRSCGWILLCRQPFVRALHLCPLPPPAEQAATMPAVWRTFDEVPPSCFSPCAIAWSWDASLANAITIIKLSQGRAAPSPPSEEQQRTARRIKAGHKHRASKVSTATSMRLVNGPGCSHCIAFCSVTG